MLTALALLPTIILMVYIYKKDGVEKEPIGLLLLAFFFGVLSTIVAMILEEAGSFVINIALDQSSIAYAALEIIIVALAEEFVKMKATKLAVWKKPAFNYMFDAIVYCVFAAMGFAALENILYVIDGGIGTALVRGFVSVPSHACDGVVMGVFFGRARFCENRGDMAGKKLNLWLSVLVPAVEHFIFDFCLTIEVNTLLWLAFVVIFDIIALIIVKKTSKNDRMIL